MRSFSAPDRLRVGNVLAIEGAAAAWAAAELDFMFDGSKFHAMAGEADADLRGIGGVNKLPAAISG